MAFFDASSSTLVIPQKLKEHAGLTKSLIILGAQEHAEIWDSDKWNERYSAISSEDVYDIMNEINF